MGALLRAIDGYEGRPETVFALKLAPHVFLRRGELRQAKWSDDALDLREYPGATSIAALCEPHNAHRAPLSYLLRWPVLIELP